MISKNKQILLVEDDVNFGTVLRDYLQLNGYKVVLARNGLEGFEKFKKNEFDICILDVMMPYNCLLYTSPSPRDRSLSRMPSSA